MAWKKLPSAVVVKNTQTEEVAIDCGNSLHVLGGTDCNTNCQQEFYLLNDRLNFIQDTVNDLIQQVCALTQRVDALDEGVPDDSNSFIETVFIDWDYNTNGSTQGTVSTGPDGLHASGSSRVRIANYWNNDVSQYEGVIFRAHGSGELRLEIGGVECPYQVLSDEPTTFMFDFAENGFDNSKPVEINLQAKSAYDLVVSDICGYIRG